MSYEFSLDNIVSQASLGDMVRPYLKEKKGTKND